MGRRPEVQHDLFGGNASATWGGFRDGTPLYRYTLRCEFDPNPFALVNFVMLNPSTAHESHFDPTVSRVDDFARRWGFDGFIVTNLFAIRSTDPKGMLSHPDPVGPDNDLSILKSADASAMVVCAWGTHGAHRDRGEIAERILRASRKGLYCLATTKGGHPWHPLYLRSDLRPREWKGYGNGNAD